MQSARIPFTAGIFLALCVSGKYLARPMESLSARISRAIAAITAIARFQSGLSGSVERHAAETPCIAIRRAQRERCGPLAPKTVIGLRPGIRFHSQIPVSNTILAATFRTESRNDRGAVPDSWCDSAKTRATGTAYCPVWAGPNGETGIPTTHRVWAGHSPRCGMLA